MTNRPRVEVVGVMLGLSALALTDPLVRSWWPGALIAGGVAGLGALAVGQAVNNLPVLSARLVAAVTTITIAAGGMVAVGIAGSRANTLQDTAIVLTGYVLLRLVGATVDRLTPSVNISLIASFVGTAVGLATVALVLVTRPHLSVWAVLGIGVGLGYAEGVITGLALRPGSMPTR
jgi:hypothetical protein